MKRFIAIVIGLVILVTVAMFAGCGNMSVGFGNFTYERVHIDTHNYSGCLTVEKWYESGTGIEVSTEEAGSLFLSEGTYILIDGDKGCPFCKN